MALISLLNNWTALSLHTWFEENSKNYKMQVIALKEKNKVAIRLNVIGISCAIQMKFLKGFVQHS